MLIQLRTLFPWWEASAEYEICTLFLWKLLLPQLLNGLLGVSLVFSETVTVGLYCSPDYCRQSTAATSHTGMCIPLSYLHILLEMMLQTHSMNIWWIYSGPCALTPSDLSTGIFHNQKVLWSAVHTCLRGQTITARNSAFSYHFPGTFPHYCNSSKIIHKQIKPQNLESIHWTPLLLLTCCVAFPPAFLCCVKMTMVTGRRWLAAKSLPSL